MDEVTYIRFASLYLNLVDLGSLTRVVDWLPEQQQ